MLKPKSHMFKLKFHLTKIQALNNKVNSKVHAYLHIDNEQLQFKGSPQLKKNVAVFGSDLEFDNFMINFDEITGLYQNKKVLLVIEFQTQGAYVKIGEVNINVGQILNEKKYRVVNVYPLSKCYDKTAKAKLAVDFVPISEKKELKVQDNKYKSSVTMQSKKQQINQNYTSNVGGGNSGYYKNPTGVIKSRLAQQQNVILQQRIYEYEKRMDNYRLSQNELSQRMQQQLQRKDEKISQLSLDLTKLQNSLHLITMQNQSSRNQIKNLNDQISHLRFQSKSLHSTIQSLQKSLSDRQKQIQSKNVSLQNLQRTKENKQKHLTSEIQKYTNKYSQSEQERNKIIFELENKLKQQLEKKDHHYQELLKANESKYLEGVKSLKERNRFLEKSSKELEELSQQHDNKIKALTLELEKALNLSQQQEEEMIYLNQEYNKVKKLKESLSNEIDSLNFSYQEAQNQIMSKNQTLKHLKKQIQALKTQLTLSNQTIDEQRQKLIVLNKQLQLYQERVYYMKEHYEEEIQDKQINEQNILGQKTQILLQLKKTKEELKLTEEKYQQEKDRSQSFKTSYENLQRQFSARNTQLMKLGQQKIYLQSQLKNLRSVKNELQEQILKISEQKSYLNNALMEKKVVLQNDKSLEWSYKIQALQNDIQVMVQKFKVEKDSLKQQYRKQEAKKIDQINKLGAMNKKLKDQIQQLKQKFNKNHLYLLSVEKSLTHQKQKSNDLQKQLFVVKENYKILNTEWQILEQNTKEISKTKEHKDKQILQTQKKVETIRKDLTKMKNGFNRIISIMLQYMVKRYNQRISYQEINFDQIQGQIVSYVNVALKKFCDDHNKTRDLIKDLEQFKKQTLTNAKKQSNYVENKQRFSYQNDETYYSQQYIPRKVQYPQQISLQEPHQYSHQYRNYFKSSKGHLNISPTRQSTVSQQLFFSQTNNPTKQLQSYRYELDRYKKEQSQCKVKIKNLEEIIQKHERQQDNQKFQYNRLKVEIQQAHDQITKMNFTLRKKDKVIKELEIEMKDLQKENFDLKANPSYVIDKAKQKMSSSMAISEQHRRSLEEASPIIKDLQSKLSLKDEEMVHAQKQLENIRQQYISSLNQIKKLEQRLKERNQKVFSLQKEFQTSTVRKMDDKQKQILRLRKHTQQLSEQLEQMSQKLHQTESTLKQYQFNISAQQTRIKQLLQQLKNSQYQMKRATQSTQFKLNDKATLYQTQIMQYKAQLSQQHEKIIQKQKKLHSLTLAVQKKQQQIEKVLQKLQKKQKQLQDLKEQFNEYKSIKQLKVNELGDKIRELEICLERKSYELQECRFAYEGRVLELDRRIQEFRDKVVAEGKYR